jgi:hypothetical protein
MYEQSLVDSSFNMRLEAFRAETLRSMMRIEDKLNTISQEIRSLQREAAMERSRKKLNRWFFLLMLVSAVLNLAVGAMLNT